MNGPVLSGFPQVSAEATRELSVLVEQSRYEDRAKIARFLRASVGVLRAGGQTLQKSEAMTLVELIRQVMERGPVVMTPEMNGAMATLLAGLADGLDGGAA